MSELVVGPLRAEHWPVIASWFTGPRDVAVWSGPSSRYPVDRAQLEPVLAEMAATPAKRLARVATVDGAVIGHAQMALDRALGTATLQRVAIAPEVRGSGYARMLLEPMLTEVFAIPEFARVELLVFPFNLPAIRTYRTLGFVEEGCLRRSMPFGEERWDTLVLGLLREDWQGGGPAAPTQAEGHS